jgi:hypothetical protein
MTRAFRKIKINTTKINSRSTFLYNNAREEQFAAEQRGDGGKGTGGVVVGSVGTRWSHINVVHGSSMKSLLVHSATSDAGIDRRSADMGRTAQVVERNHSGHSIRDRQKS